MAPGFTITQVRFRGEGVSDAIVDLAAGLSVIAGPSNTGKSLLLNAIDFVFGSSTEMKNVMEAAPYELILVEIRTAEGTPITFGRAYQGGDIRRYHLRAAEIMPTSAFDILGATHDPDKDDTISAVLLSLSGLFGIKMLRGKTKGEVGNLSFRDLVEYVLIREARIMTELSPIHTENFAARTRESSIFRILLTGKDDREIVSIPSTKDQKIRAAGQDAAFEEIKADLRKRLPPGDRGEDDYRRAAAAVDKRIAEQTHLLHNYRTDLTELEQQRRALEEDHRRAMTRLTEIGAHFKRFELLRQQYESDLQRLQSNVEAGSLLTNFQEGPCPVCGASPEHHHHHGITQEELNEYTDACRAEAEKIQARQGDLAETVTELQNEQAALRAGLAQIAQQRKQAADALKAIIEPSIANLGDGITDLGEERAELARIIATYEELRRLDEIEQRLARVPATKAARSKITTALAPNDYEAFARAVEDTLRAWTFPELDRVTYDARTEDINIAGKARKDNGKGYRALTYAAFMIAVLKETMRKGLPHPGFIVLDSPLVTYREKDEHIGEGVKAAFYRDLAATVAPTQVIVLENEDPPEDLKLQIAYTGFTKDRRIGRYGLLPPLPETNPPESDELPHVA